MTNDKHKQIDDLLMEVYDLAAISSTEDAIDKLEQALKIIKTEFNKLNIR